MQIPEDPDENLKLQDPCSFDWIQKVSEISKVHLEVSLQSSINSVSAPWQCLCDIVIRSKKYSLVYTSNKDVGATAKSIFPFMCWLGTTHYQMLFLELESLYVCYVKSCLLCLHLQACFLSCFMRTYSPRQVSLIKQ